MTLQMNTFFCYHAEKKYMEDLSKDLLKFPKKPENDTSLFLGKIHSRNCQPLYLSDYSDRWNAYGTGYAWALKVLLNQATQRNYPTETHYYPIIFVFRQYLEIRLKNLIINLNEYLGENENIIDHNLEKLWASSNKLLIQFFKNDENSLADEEVSKEFHDDLNLIGKFVLEIHKLDPTSQALRYPISKKNRNPNFFNSQHAPKIDMNHFSKNVHWVIDSLETLQYMIDEQYQKRCAAEWDSEHSD